MNTKMWRDAVSKLDWTVLTMNGG